MLNTLRPRQNGRHFPEDIFKCIFLNEYVWISIKISLKFVPWGPINNIQALAQIMAWHRPCNKPLSEPMIYASLSLDELTTSSTHIDHITEPSHYHSQFSQNSSKQIPHSSPIRTRNGGVFCKFKFFDFFLPQSLQCCMEYNVILNCIIMAPEYAGEANRCYDNVVQYYMILHTAQQWLKQNISRLSAKLQ